LDTKGAGGLLQGLLPFQSGVQETKDDSPGQKEEEDKPEDAAKSLFNNLLNSR
jgi:hypothetical protein